MGNVLDNGKGHILKGEHLLETIRYSYVATQFLTGLQEDSCIDYLSHKCAIKFYNSYINSVYTVIKPF